MFVNGIPGTSRARLVQFAVYARLIGAAKLMASETDIAVVHEHERVLQRVVTKTDVVRQMSVCEGAAGRCPLSMLMTHNLVLCHGSDLLQDVALKIKTRHLKNIAWWTRPVDLLGC